MAADESDERTYVVVSNDEEQYSIWLNDREVPAGWNRHEFIGKKESCLEHIRLIWPDIRPKSLRDALRRAETSK